MSDNIRLLVDEYYKEDTYLVNKFDLKHFREDLNTVTNLEKSYKRLEKAQNKYEKRILALQNSDIPSTQKKWAWTLSNALVANIVGSALFSPDAGPIIGAAVGAITYGHLDESIGEEVSFEKEFALAKKYAKKVSRSEVIRGFALNEFYLSLGSSQLEAWHMLDEENFFSYKIEETKKIVESFNQHYEGLSPAKLHTLRHFDFR